MTGLLVTLASSDPLTHVLNSDLAWLTDNLLISKHVLYLLLAATLCLLVFPMVAGKLVSQLGTTRGIPEKLRF